MVSRTESSNVTALFRFLVTYRLLVYFGGLFVIGLPLLLRALGIEISAPARTALVVVTLSVMVLTYIGERRVDSSDSREETPSETYSLRLRLLLAGAALGIGIGLYTALQINTLSGIVVIIGAYFLGYLGYKLET